MVKFLSDIQVFIYWPCLIQDGNRLVFFFHFINKLGVIFSLQVSLGNKNLNFETVQCRKGRQGKINFFKFPLLLLVHQQCS